MALVALTSCGDPLRVEVIDHYDERLIWSEPVEEACEILGVECSYVDEPYGAVRIIFFDPKPGGVREWMVDGRGCKRKILSEERGSTLAHGLWHALGRPSKRHHTDDPSNIGNIGGYGWEVTDRQKARILRHIDILNACR